MTQSGLGSVNVVAGTVGDIRSAQTYYEKVEHLEVHQDAPAKPIAFSPVPQPALEEALERLRQLPLEDIPPPAALPAGSSVTMPRNPLFVGRQDDLRRLAQALKGGETMAIGQTAAATGLGGIGKTQLAAEFAHRYGPYFLGGVFWLSFADPGAIESQIAFSGLPGGLGLPKGYPDMELKDQVRLVRAAWTSPLPRLLVFDNCEEPELLAEYRPAGGGCRVLATSRRQDWEIALGVQCLHLEVLPRPESVALLRQFRPDLPAKDPTLDAIAKELGDLPLALHLAGSYLKKYQYEVTLQDYLEKLRQPDLLEHPSLQGRGARYSPTGHENHVARTFALSHEKLDPGEPVDAQALVLLACAAHFVPGEPVPRDLLKVAEVIHVGQEGEAGGDNLLAEDALARLGDLGLLEAGSGGALRLHRLLAAFVHGLPGSEETRTAVEKAVLAMANLLNNAGYPAPLLAWQQHLRHVTDLALPRRDVSAAGLGISLGYHLTTIADYDAARHYYEQALAIHRETLGEKHPNTATSLNNMGGLLESIGDYAAARPYYEQALAIRREALGEKHPDTAGSLNNLGMLLQAIGDHAAARSYLEQALAINEASLGAQHPDTQIVRKNLAAVEARLKEDSSVRDDRETTDDRRPATDDR